MTIDSIETQIFLYVTNIALGLAALALYGGWLWRIRADWCALPLGWLLAGLLLDRLSVVVNEGYWLTVKTGTHFRFLDPSWLASSGAAAKLFFVAANLAVICAYFRARQS